MASNPATGIKRAYKDDRTPTGSGVRKNGGPVLRAGRRCRSKSPTCWRGYVGYRSQSVVAVTWLQYQADPRFGMCFRMRHKKNAEEHWLPASPELQTFLASIKVRTPDGPIALRRNGKPWESEEQLQKRSSNFLTGLARSRPGWRRPDRARPAGDVCSRDKAPHRSERRPGCRRPWRQRRPHGRALHAPRRAGKQDTFPLGAANENRTRFGKRGGPGFPNRQK